MTGAGPAASASLTASTRPAKPARTEPTHLALSTVAIARPFSTGRPTRFGVKISTSRASATPTGVMPARTSPPSASAYQTCRGTS